LHRILAFFQALCEAVLKNQIRSITQEVEGSALEIKRAFWKLLLIF